MQRLRYVAVTRARHELVLTSCGQGDSSNLLTSPEFLALMDVQGGSLDGEPAE